MIDFGRQAAKRTGSDDPKAAEIRAKRQAKLARYRELAEMWAKTVLPALGVPDEPVPRAESSDGKLLVRIAETSERTDKAMAAFRWVAESPDADWHRTRPKPLGLRFFLDRLDELARTASQPSKRKHAASERGYHPPIPEPTEEVTDEELWTRDLNRELPRYKPAAK